VVWTGLIWLRIGTSLRALVDMVMNIRVPRNEQDFVQDVYITCNWTLRPVSLPLFCTFCRLFSDGVIVGSNLTMTDKWWTEKDLEGNFRGIIKVLIRHLPSRSQTTETSLMIAGVRPKLWLPALASKMILDSESHGTHNYTSLSDDSGSLQNLAWAEIRNDYLPNMSLKHLFYIVMTECW
jgi:hypothetical protein